MPRINPVQTSFSLGEVSPRMIARSDIKGYKEGALAMQGLVPLVQGPFRRRSGLHFGNELAAGPSVAKVIPFPGAGPDDYFMLVFYDTKLQVLNKWGEQPSTDYVTNPSFASSGGGWTAFEPGAAVVTFSRFSAELSPAAVAGDAAIRQNVAGLTIGVTYRVRVSQTYPLNKLRIRVGTAAGGAQVGEVSSSADSICYEFVATAVSHWIEVAAMTINVTSVLTNVSLAVANVALTPIVSPFTADNIGRIQYEMAPGATGVMMLTDGIVFPQQLTLTPPFAFALINAPFISPPASWVANNYPRALTFYQGRLWMGGIASAPSQFWGSKSGAILNFTLGTLADDAVSYTIAKRGEIRWMSGLKSLLIGTESQEYAVSSDAGVITPTDIKLDPQSGYGSAPIQPALLGNQIIYITQDGRKLYSMGYRFEESGWVSTDLSFAAEHITAGRLVAEAFAQNPDSVLWFVDQQGLLIGCSYDRGNNIVGWHKHPSSIFFLSACSIKYLGNDVAWAAYRVVRAGVAYIQIGRLPRTVSSGMYMDGYKRVTLPVATNVFPGFQHLSGFTVQVVADGSNRPVAVVDGAGNVTIEGPAAFECAVGLSNTVKFTSLPVEPGSNGQPTQPAMKRTNKIFLQLLDGCRPIINGKRPADRDPATPMGLAQPSKTELVFVSKLGWDRQAIITVEEDLPIDVGVGGIYSEMAEEQT